MSARDCQHCGEACDAAAELCAPCELNIVKLALKDAQAERDEARQMLRAATDEVRALRADASVAIDTLMGLRKAMDPSATREALRNVLELTNPGHPIAQLGDHDVLWTQVAPAYKVEEVLEVALAHLRGGR